MCSKNGRANGLGKEREWPLFCLASLWSPVKIYRES
jgi:hypothetical protein